MVFSPDLTVLRWMCGVSVLTGFDMRFSRRALIVLTNGSGFCLQEVR
jgi:hypothetical protein